MALRRSIRVNQYHADSANNLCVRPRLTLLLESAVKFIEELFFGDCRQRLFLCCQPVI